MNLLTWSRRKAISFYGRIVKEKATPEFIARGWAIGMFAGCMIPFGVQLAVSLPAAYWMKGSKIGAVFGTLLTNHFTIFIIYPLQCYAGNRLIGGSLNYDEIVQAMELVLKEQSYSALLSIGGELVTSFFVGGAILTAVMTPLTYVGVKWLVIHYRALKEKKQQDKLNRR